MSLELFGVQKGIKVNGNDGAATLYMEKFAGAPGSGFGANGDYAIDSVTGHFYKKSAGTWAKFGISADIQSASAGLRVVSGFDYYTTTDVSAFSGLSQTLDGTAVTLTNGDLVASVGAVYVASSGAWTLYGTQPSDNDIMFIQNSMPDVSLSRGIAMYKFVASGPGFVKIADFDFETANTIGFLSYTAPASNAVTAITGTETVQGTVEKLDTMALNVRSALGIAITDVNLGTMNGSTVSTPTVKDAIQALIDKSYYRTSATNVTTVATVDSVASGSKARWDIVITKTATPTDMKVLTVEAADDGTNPIHSLSGIKDFGAAISGLTIDVDINASLLRLRISSTDAVDVRCARHQV